MRTKKLSSAQVRAVRNVALYGHPFGRGDVTLLFLLRECLIERTADVRPQKYRLTEIGKDAHRDGRYFDSD